MAVSWKAVTKNVSLYVLKMGVALALLYWLYQRKLLDLTPLASLQVDARVIALFVTAIALVALAIVLVATRLRLLLHPQNIFVPFRRVFALSLLGSFFASILPGLVAGDVVKTAYLFRDAAGQRSKAVATVFIDRILGLYGLLILGTAASIAAWLTGTVHDNPGILVIAPTLTLGTSVALLIFLKSSDSQSSLSGRLLKRAPEKIQNLSRAIAVYRRHRGLFSVAIAISILGHALIVMTFYIGTIILSDTLSLSEHFVIDPLAIILYMVPLTPGGLGVTESAFGYLFAEAGSPNGVVVALIGRMVQYCVFITGGSVALLVTRMRTPANPDA